MPKHIDYHGMSLPACLCEECETCKRRAMRRKGKGLSVRKDGGGWSDFGAWALFAMEITGKRAAVTALRHRTEPHLP